MNKIKPKDLRLWLIIILSVATLIAAVVLILCFKKQNEKVPEPDVTKIEISEIRGVWIASVYGLDFPSAPDLSADQLKAEVDKIVKTASDAGLNSLFFQVRPSCDALYSSTVFPVSKYLSTNGTLQLDTLEYMITEAHKCGIAVHAWVNPLRAAVGNKSSPATDTSVLADSSPVKAHPQWCVAYSDGNLYLNPGIPEVRRLVADGITEIVTNYDVDGVIFDDYFYPYPVTTLNTDTGQDEVAVFNDFDSFMTYGDGAPKDDWRRGNVNALIEASYKAVKAADDGCLFGVAPFGVWKNTDMTRATESYSAVFCDSLAWVRGGYVDYIAPQLYWSADDENAPFNVLADWWNQSLDACGVPLVISHAAYRYGADGGYTAGAITEQLSYAAQLQSYSGSIFYRYSDIRDNTGGVTDEIRGFYSDAAVTTSSDGAGTASSDTE